MCSIHWGNIEVALVQEVIRLYNLRLAGNKQEVLKLHRVIKFFGAGARSEVTAETVQLVKKAQLLRITATKLKGVSPKALEVSTVPTSSPMTCVHCPCHWYRCWASNRVAGVEAMYTVGHLGCGGHQYLFE